MRGFVYHLASTTGSTFEHPTQRGVQPEGLAAEAKLGPHWIISGQFPIRSFWLEDVGSQKSISDSASYMFEYVKKNAYGNHIDIDMWRAGQTRR